MAIFFVEYRARLWIKINGTQEQTKARNMSGGNTRLDITSGTQRLSVFISYAPEDAVLAQAIKAELETAFRAIIRTTLEPELKLGVNWRSALEEALNDADVLLLVVTGRDKLSHSFTGYEVGYFLASKRDRGKMKDFDSQRLIIPIGIVETPKALDSLGELTSPPLFADLDSLKDKQRFLDDIASDDNKNHFLQLFIRIKEVVKPLDRFGDPDFYKMAKESASRLYMRVFEEFQQRVFSVMYPERKVIVRLPINAPVGTLEPLPEDMTVEFIGGTFDIFQIDAPPDRQVTWGTILQSSRNAAFCDNLKSLILAVRLGGLPEDKQLTSADGSRFFKMFVGRSVVYYSGIAEIHIYVFEVMPRQQKLIVSPPFKRVALVIGNSSYRYTGELTNPKNDAADVANALKGLGFELIDGVDLGKVAFNLKLRDFASALKDADVGVFFYAGHGLQVAGQNYIIPVDAELANEVALDFETVPLDLVQRTMERTAPTNLLFLDACRNNPLARNLSRAMGTRSGEIKRGLAPVQAGFGTLISFSTQPGNVALDGVGRNSPFAGALVKHLLSSNEEIMGLLVDVRNDVIRETNRRQVPWEHTAMTGRFYFKTVGMALSP
jgi:hypothetical protein